MIEEVKNKNENFSSTNISLKSNEINTSYAEILKSFQTAIETKKSAIQADLNSSPTIVRTKKFMPDGSVLIITKEDGKIVDQVKKKPHMISVRDPISGEIKLESFISILDFDFM